jgi:hypothetical protein
MENLGETLIQMALWVMKGFLIFAAMVSLAILAAVFMGAVHFIIHERARGVKRKSREKEVFSNAGEIRGELQPRTISKGCDGEEAAEQEICAADVQKRNPKRRILSGQDQKGA